MSSQIQRLLNKKIAFIGSTDEGKPFVKAMLVFRREGNNIYYFDTNNGSVRVAQWKKDPTACVYFYGNPVYLGDMLSGTMEIINDMETKRLHWKPSMQSIYKDGVTDPDYCILKFTATSGRYYSMFQSENFEL